MKRLVCIAALLMGLLPAQAAESATVPGCALPGRTGWTDEGHDTDRVQFMRSTGTLRAVMLFVDFPDAQASSADTEEYAGLLRPGAAWLKEASYGRADLRITPVGRWFRMPQDSTTYGFDRGITFEQHELYVKQAVAAADAEVDFSRYDLVYIVPPKNAPSITFSPTYLFDRATDGVVADGARVKWGVTFGQDMWRWGHKVLDHETGHTMGLPDLYAFTGPDFHRFAGGWDVMGHIAGASPRFLGWHAWKLGWMSDAQVFCASGTRTYPLIPIERARPTMVVVRTSETTAYVAESRRATGLDAAACSSGVLIYKVDSAAQTGHGPIQVVDARPDAVPAQGCKPLDDAAHTAGQVFDDPAAGVRIEVVASTAGADVIRVRRR